MPAGIPKSEILGAVQQRLSNPARWAKGTYARDDSGKSVATTAEHATSWCLTEAIHRELYSRSNQADPNRIYQTAIPIYQDISVMIKEQYPIMDNKHSHVTVIQKFNDDPRISHEDILAVLEKVHTKLIEHGE